MTNLEKEWSKKFNEILNKESIASVLFTCTPEELEAAKRKRFIRRFKPSYWIYLIKKPFRDMAEKIVRYLYEDLFKL